MSSQPSNTPPPFPPNPPFQPNPPGQPGQPGQSFPPFGPTPPYPQPRAGSGAKGCWIAAGVVAAIGLLLLISAGWWFSQIYRTIAEPSTTATAFLSVNSKSGPSAAYKLTSASFQLSTTESAWTTYSQQYQLDKFTAVSWNQFQTTNDSSSVSGVVKRAGLPDLPTKMELRRVDAVWRVSYVDFTGATAPIVPSGTGAGAGVGTGSSSGGTDTTSNDGGGSMTDPGARGHSGDGLASGNSGLGGNNAPSVPVPQPAPPTALPLGQPGPPGTVVASGVVGPSCISPLWTQGFRADSVKCPLYLDSRPGASELCSAHSIDGRFATVRVTYVGYNPVTRLHNIDCRIAN